MLLSRQGMHTGLRAGCIVTHRCSLCKHVLEVVHTVADVDDKSNRRDDDLGDGDVESGFDAVAAAADRSHIRCEQCWVWSLRSSCGKDDGA